MDSKIATLIVTAATEIGLDARLYEGYAGRNMFGRTTTGVVLDNDTSLLRSVALAAGRIGEDESGVDLDAFVEALDFQRDALGHSLIVY
jgi:hypothetical protein